MSLGKEISDPCIVTSGVPQGSILGPLLFVPFVNDLPIVLERCQILMYANDTVMYFAANNAREISITITSELTKVNDWLVHNSLFIHQGKTECLLRFRYMKIHIFALRWKDEIRRSSQLRTLLKLVVVSRT